MRKNKIAIIGLGGISKFYIKAIKKQSWTKLSIVCDSDKNKLIPFTKSGTQTAGSVNALLAYKNFDSVIVATPNFTHFEIIKKCINAGKHVLCEKPMAINLKQVTFLTALAKKKNVLLMTAFHRRYNKNLLPILHKKKEYQFIHARYLEDIKIHSGNESWYLAPKQSGGGCVIDNGINVFDMLNHLTNDLKIKKTHINFKHKYDHKALILMSFNKNKGKAIVELDWHHKKEIKDLVLVDHNSILKKINLLAGSKKFKESLWHEYKGVVDDFLKKLKQKNYEPDTDNITAMKLVEKAYKNKSLF